MLSLTRLITASPAARLFVALGAVAITLTGCQQATPPPLTEADLRSVFAMKVLGHVPKGPALDRLFSSDSGMCVDLHGGGAAFAEFRVLLDDWDKLKLDLGFAVDRSEWQSSDEQQKPLEPVLAHRLNRAEDRAILKVARAAERDIVPPSRKPWPKRCEMRSWFGAPAYESRFAFIESGYSCGDLCGAGEILALEYRDGRWRLIAKKASWIA